MGFSNGTPTISTDGLVFAVDAGNSQSYVSGSLDTFSLVSSNTGSIHNDVDFSSANQGSWVFDGSDDNIVCGDIPAISGATEVSISMWMKFTTDMAFSIVAGKNLVVDDNGFQFYCWSANELRIWIKSGGTGTTSMVNISSLTSVGEWNNFVIVFNGALANDERCKLYLNGGTDILTNNGTMPTTFTNNTEPYLIARGTNGYLTGEVANTLIYNKALSEAEVTQNYNATKGRFI